MTTTTTEEESELLSPEGENKRMQQEPEVNDTTTTGDPLSIKISKEMLQDSYCIDFASLVAKPITTAKVPLEQPVSSEEEEQPKRRQRCRKDEGEEYDLDDPFIDDTELPPGVTLQDLLSGNYESEEMAQEVAPIKIDFYVWKGRLPEKEFDPLWEEKLVEKKKKKSQRSKRKASSSPDKEVKRKKRPKVSKEEKGDGLSGPPSDSGKKKSILDRIQAIGEDDDDLDILGGEEEVGSSAKAGPSMIPSPEKSKTLHDDSGDERMRKKLDITTPLLELEYKLTLEAFKEEATRTAFTDPKRFPSNLRPVCNEALIACLRQLDKKTELPEYFFESIGGNLPFPVAALQKLIYGKIVPLYRDELKAKVIPELFVALTGEISNIPEPSGGGEGKKKPRWNERTREIISDIIRHELDSQALDRLSKAQSGIKPEPFSEISIRKALYPRISACWPAGEMGTAELGREYSVFKRKQDTKKLKEHGIEVTPILVPIAKPKIVARETDATVVPEQQQSMQGDEKEGGIWAIIEKEPDLPDTRFLSEEVNQATIPLIESPVVPSITSSVIPSIVLPVIPPIGSSVIQPSQAIASPVVPPPTAPPSAPTLESHPKE